MRNFKFITVFASFALIATFFGHMAYDVFVPTQPEPFMLTQRTPTTVLCNDLDEDLYRVQLASIDTERPMHVHSLAVHITSSSSAAYVDHLRVRIGSTDLHPSAYRIVRTIGGTDLGPAGSVSTSSEELTIIFTEEEGLLIVQSGLILTLVGTPHGFSSGDNLNVAVGNQTLSEPSTMTAI